MSKMSVPITVRRGRHTPKAFLSEIAAYEYMLKTLRRHVISEKYVLDKHMLALDMFKPDKRMVKMAVEAIFNVKVLKVNSCVRKPYVKFFKGQKGFTSEYSRVYIRTDSPVNIKILDAEQKEVSQ